MRANNYNSAFIASATFTVNSSSNEKCYRTNGTLECAHISKEIAVPLLIQVMR